MYNTVRVSRSTDITDLIITRAVSAIAELLASCYSLKTGYVSAI